MDMKLKAAHQKLTDRVMGWNGVTGTAIGERSGKPCLKVYVTDKRFGGSLPKTMEGFPVEVEVTGPFNPR